MRVDQLLQIPSVLAGARQRRRHQLGQNAIHGRGAARGFILQLVGGMIAVAQQRGALGTQHHQLLHDLGIVGGAAAAAGGRGLE